MAKKVVAGGSYQENLDAIKEQGSVNGTNKPSKVPKRIVAFDPGDRSRPTVPDYNIPFPSADRSQYGDSGFDEGMQLPTSIFDMGSEAQQEVFQGELTETRAQNQPKGYKLGAFVPRALMKTGIEFVRGLGYLGAVPGAIVEGDMKTIVENGFTKAMDDFEEATNEVLPVYSRREVQEGSFLRQIWSPEFWGSEAADGVGFMASSILMGGASQGIAKGIAKGLLNTGKFVGMAPKNVLVAEETIKLLGITSAQSYVESMAESHGAIQDFNRNWEGYKQPNGTYVKEINGVETVFTQDDINDLKAELVSDTFFLNMGVTALPNWFMSKAFFGSGGAARNFFSQFGVDPKKAGKGIAAAMKKSSFNKVKKMATEGGKGALNEATQENIQYSIQIYGEKKSRDLEDVNMVSTLLEGMYDAFTTVEGKKSMFLGALLGLGPGLKKGHSEYKANVKRANDLVKLLEDNWVDVNSQLQGYLKENDKGELEIDKAKIQEDFKNAERELKDVMGLEEAKMKGLPMHAKAIMARILIKKAIPYFQSEETMEMLQSKLPELTENMTGLDKFGFASKEEAATFVNDIVGVAKEKMDLAKRKGPRHFGLDITQFRKEIAEDETTAEALERIYQGIEVQYALQGALLDHNQKEQTKLSSEIAAIEAEVDAAYTTQFPEGTAVSVKEKITSLKKPISQANEYASLLADRATIEHNIEVIDKDMQLLFDKEEQQKALENYTKMIKAQKRAQEDMRQGQEEAKKLNNDFRDRMVDLGYFNSAEEMQAAITDGSINNTPLRLKDKNGKIWAFKKVGEAPASQWFIFPIDPETGQALVGEKPEDTGVLVTFELMKEMGLNEDSILTKEEYGQWKYEIDARRTNSQYLDAVAKTLDLAEHTRIERAGEIEALQQKLNAINETLESWKDSSGTLFTEIPSESLIAKLSELEAEKEAIAKDIAGLEQAQDSIREEILYYENLRETIFQAVEDGVKIDPTFELAQLRDNLKEDGIYTKRYDKLGELSEALEDDIANLNAVYSSVNEALNELYVILNKTQAFKKMLESGSLKESDIRKFIHNNIDFIRENYPEFLKDPSNPKSQIVNIGMTVILFDDPDIRAGFLKSIKNSIKKGQILYGEIRQDVTRTQKALETAQRKLSNVTKYMKTKKFVENIMEAREIEERMRKGTGRKKIKGFQTQNPKARIEQGEGVEIEQEQGPRKEWMYSTIASFWEDGITGNMRDTTTPEYKQAVNWAAAMGSIPLAELGNYSVRAVNPSQLQALGQKPPVDGEADLYAVLLQDGTPFTSEDGSIVFAGIATTEYYFPEGESRINFQNDPEYIRIENRSKEISKENPYSITVNGKREVFYSKTEAIGALIERRKAEYDAWRTGVVNKLKAGGNINLPIRHISRGWPAAIETSKDVQKYNPKKSLGVKNVIVAKKGTIELDNQESMQAQQGMLYGRLENGHMQRLMNYSIGQLPAAKQKETLDRIINFMALAKYAGRDGKKMFTFKGTKSGATSYNDLPLFGSSAKPGIMDYFINWNSERDAFNIHHSKLPNGKQAFVFKDQNENETWIGVEELYDGNRVRKSNDSSAKIQQLVEFLKSKYLNVVGNQLSNPKTLKPKAFRMPTGYTKGPLGEMVITYDPKNNYDEFVLDNYLYTHIPPQTENSAVPRYVNQYAIFDFNEKVPGPPTPTVDEAPTTTSTAGDNITFTVNQVESAIIKATFTNPNAIIPEEGGELNEDAAKNLMEAAGEVVDNENEENKKCKTKGGVFKKSDNYF